MKLTQTKNAKNADFFRNTQQGKLVVREKSGKEALCDKTACIVEKLPHDTSFVGRILARPNKPKNNDSKTPIFQSFAESLVCADRAIDGSCIPECPSDKSLEEWLHTNLSAYGRGLHCPAPGSPTLEEILQRHYAGEPVQEELEQLKKYISELKTKKMDKLKKSIANNRIPFEPVDAHTAKLRPTSARMQWLFSFLQKDGVPASAFDFYLEHWRYTELEKKLNEIINSYWASAEKDSRKKLSLTKCMYEAVLAHNHSVYEACKQECEALAGSAPQMPAGPDEACGRPQEQALSDREKMSFFLNEVRDHFRNYYPVKSKTTTLSPRLVNLSKKSALHYCSEEFVLREVKRHIVNQLVAGLIQYGKLTHYFYDQKAGWQEAYFCSDGLSYIQVEEAFKKQMFLSVAWAGTRLCYFFNYGGHNKAMLNQNKLEEPNATRFGGDILADSRYRERYIKYLREQPAEKNLQAEKEAARNRLWEKMRTAFPLKETDAPETAIALLEEAGKNLEELRNNIYHYRKGNLLELVASKNENPGKCAGSAKNSPSRQEPEATPPIKTALEMLQRDVDSVPENFREQIRSSGIAEYYPLHLLQKIFAEGGPKFYLYAPRYPMMPSFKNVYKKGENLYKSNSKPHERNIHWFVDAQSFAKQFAKQQGFAQGKQAWVAYKNLLQLLYYHSFLPAVSIDNRLVTDFINKTIEWNQDDSIQHQKIQHQKANSKAEDDKIEYHRYRYADMPEYKNYNSLHNYLADLQRQQSLQEEIKPEKKVPKNYYLEFVRDVFVHAFGAYLQDKISDCYAALMRPQKIAALQNGESPEQTLRALSGLTMHTNLKQHLAHMRKPQTWPETQDAKEEREKKQIKFAKLYLLLRLLDARELNVLLHQFIRYRTAQGKRPNLFALSGEAKQDTELQKAQDTELQKAIELEELMALVLFTLPPLEEKQHSETMFTEFFASFVEGDLRNYEHLYYQTDRSTRVQHRSMSLMGRTGAMALYVDMFCQQQPALYKICRKKYETYCQFTLLGEGKRETGQTKIEAMQDELQRLHQELLRVSPKEKATEKVERYRSLLKQVQEYTWLRQKLTFETLYKVHQIHVDILSRFASFAQDWERDMRFLLTALQCENLLQVNLSEIFDKGRVVGNLSKALNNEQKKKLLYSLLWSTESYDAEKLKRFYVRNTLAHLNHMTQRLLDSGEVQPNILELTNRLRWLLAYDRKRQNAVTKALTELLEKQHHIKLTLKVQQSSSSFDHTKRELQFCSLKSVEQRHLKHLTNLKKPVTIEVHDDFFLRLVERLLTFKYPKPGGCEPQANIALPHDRMGALAGK